MSDQDKGDGLVVVVMVLISALERGGFVKREEWTGELRRIAAEFQKVNLGSPETAQIERLLKMFDPAPTLHDQRPPPALSVIDGGLVPEE